MKTRSETPPSCISFQNTKSSVLSYSVNQSCNCFTRHHRRYDLRSASESSSSHEASPPPTVASKMSSGVSILDFPGEIRNQIYQYALGNVYKSYLHRVKPKDEIVWSFDLHQSLVFRFSAIKMGLFNSTNRANSNRDRDFLKHAI
jgi:hypothetical protein